MEIKNGDRVKCLLDNTSGIVYAIIKTNKAYNIHYISYKDDRGFTHYHSAKALKIIDNK